MTERGRTIADEEVLAQLDRLCADSRFARADKLQRFLRFIVEETLAGRHESIQEYTIGLEAFDRRETFDPRTDSIVRVQGGRLRERLKDYYATDGAEDPVVVELADRGYATSFRRREQAARRTPPTANRRGVIGAVAALALLLVIAGSVWRPGDAPPAEPGPTPRQLTFEPGLATWPDLSSDGQTLLFASDREGDMELWVQRIGGGPARRLTYSPGAEVRARFSHDGAKVYYIRVADQSLYEVPTEGGPPKLLLRDILHVRESPGGSWLAYSYQKNLGYSLGLRILPTEGGAPLEFGQEYRLFGAGILWLDDDHLLTAGLTTGRTGPGSDGDFFVVSPSSGEVRASGVDSYIGWQHPPYALPPPPYEPLAWLASARTMVLPGYLGDTVSLWGIPFHEGRYEASGPARPLLRGAPRARYAAGGGDAVVYTQESENVDLWRIPIDHRAGKVTGPPERLTSSLSTERNPRVSRDGRTLAYESYVPAGPTGVGKILTMPIADRKRAPVSHASGTGFTGFVISPDGERIAYSMRDDDRGSRIYIQGVDREEPELLCEGCSRVSDWSADGRFVLHSGESKGFYATDVATRETARVAERRKNPISAPVFSPDGEWIAFHSMIRGPLGTQVFIAPFRWGRLTPESEWIAVTDGAQGDLNPVWSPSGDRLYFLSERLGLGSIWTIRLDARTKHPLGDAGLVFKSKEPGRHLGTAFLHALYYSTIAVLGDALIVDLAEVRGNVWMVDGPSLVRASVSSH